MTSIRRAYQTVYLTSALPLGTRRAFRPALGSRMPSAPAGRVWIPALVLLVFIALLAPPVAAFPQQGGPDREFPALGDGPIALADFVGDANPDLAAVDDATGYVRLYVGGPSGLPRDPQYAEYAPGVTDLAAGDLNGDGRADLLAVDGQRVFWFDSETFRSSAGIPVTGARAVQAGDLNGDGREDLAVLGTTGAYVWFQRATGDFAGTADLPLFETASFTALAVGDANGDGRDDLVLAGTYQMQVFLQGTQFLDPNSIPLWFPGTGGMTSVAIVDGGNLPFLVCAAPAAPGEDAYVGLWRWTGTEFGLETTMGGPYTNRLAVGDLNDDGRPDLALVRIDGSISVFLQHSGTFAATVPDWTLGGGQTGDARVAVGDVNGDGFSDVLHRVPGKYLVYLQEDAMPVLIHAIPNEYRVNRGSVAKGAVDLRQFFRDDHNRLTFAVVSESDPEHVTATVVGDTLDLVAGDWYGTADFRVSAWDGNPNHPPVESNVFTVLVNDPPAITTVPGLRAVAGSEYSYIVTVADAYPAGDPHTFSLREAPPGMAIDAETGLITWTPAADQDGEHTVIIEVRDGNGGFAEQQFGIVVVGGGGAPSPILMAFGIALSSAALMAAAALINENAKYAFLLFFLPLYTKIKRERVLDHFVRGQIFGYIQANPGEHYNAIKDALGLTNGSLAHHLRTLEREQFIKSKRFGLYRRFYPMNYRMPADDAYQPNDVQQTIIEVVRAHPGITQKEISQRLGITPPTVNYHIAVLSERNLIRVERSGRSTHCSVVEGGSS